MLDLKKIVAVGYDLDGTLYKHTHEAEERTARATARLISRLNPEFTEERAYRYYNEAYPRLRSNGGVIAEAARLDPNHVPDDWIDDARLHEILTPDFHLAELLESISQKYKTYLLTSSTEKSARLKLEALHIPLGVFREMAFTDTRIGSKSKGTAYLYMASKLGIPPENHVYVGDRLKQDISPPRALGMQTIAVWSEIPEATHSIANPYELKILL